jgi:putative glutamine amidotransferase
LKLIGITQRVVVDPKHGERRDALDQRWPEFLATVGVLGIALPNRPELAVRLASELGVSGLVLTGGNDLAAYGGDAPERDATEAALIDWARSHATPLMGVCRGMQVILHGLGAPLERAEGHVTASHPVLVDGAPRNVNSYHNFVARKAVPTLHVWGTAADGSIEAIRHDREPILGVMWHPERVNPFETRDVAMFREFFGVKG